MPSAKSLTLCSQTLNLLPVPTMYHVPSNLVAQPSQKLFGFIVNSSAFPPRFHFSSCRFVPVLRVMGQKPAKTNRGENFTTPEKNEVEIIPLC